MNDVTRQPSTHGLGARPDDLPEIGQWAWVRAAISRDGQEWPDSKKGDAYEWLGCISHVGSNYVRIDAPRAADRTQRYIRIHFDQLDSIRIEANPDAVISTYVTTYKAEAQRLMDEVAATLANLGFDRAHALAHAMTSADASNALVVLSQAVDPKAYGRALQLAKDKTLPDLFERIKVAHGQLAVWTGASLLPMQASVDAMKASMSGIEDRLFSLELYAGLTESAEKIADGPPAAAHEKLRVMQRRLYMDEECLANYDAGGMTFSNIGEFDAWLARPDNRDRILPFPRTFVAFRVRRYEKERRAESFHEAFVNFQLAQLDKLTFFYVRNGDQIWRFQSEFSFPEMIAPSRDFYDPRRPAMFRLFADRVDEIVPRAEYDDALARYHDNQRKEEDWNRAHPKSESFRNPFRHRHIQCGKKSHFDPKDWHPLDPSSVHYDDASDLLSQAVRTFNRVAVIIQGLFDRSEVLHPHPKVSIWTPEGFERAIEIVYDGEHVLTSGDPPDFGAYRARLTAQITADSVLMGQQDYWLRAEAKRENERRSNAYRNRWSREDVCLETFQPWGNNGPGKLARPAIWRPKTKTATFAWLADRQRHVYGAAPDVRKTITVPADALFNVSAYKPGDYKIFFADPRTRQAYLRWAPFLLTAEEFHAGKIKLRESK